MDNIKPDSAKAVEFLQHMNPSGPHHLLAMLPDGKPNARTFHATQTAETVAWIEKHQHTHNIYFSVNSLKASVSNKKATKADVESSCCLHVDVDDLTALDRIRHFKLQPTAVICSGGGYQAFSHLSESTTDLARVERCNLGLARELGGDNCHNADRVMRLPWTVNVPNKKKRAAGRQPTVAYVVEEMTDWSRVHPIEAFDEFHPPDGPSPPGMNVAVPSPQIATLDALPNDVSAFTRSLIERGDDSEQPPVPGVSRYPSRSEVVFRVACDLARANCADEVIAGILINPAYGISASVLEKKTPWRYAMKQANAARAAIGTSWPDVGRHDKPRPTFRNTMIAISRLTLHCEYDEFHRRKVIGGHSLQAYQGELSDDGCAVLRNLILQNYGFDPGKDHTREAANTLCLENTYHPIRDYLDGLVWDGRARLDRWMETYLGAEDTPLNRAFAELILTAAVRRVRQPGAKFDNILVLEGAQGSGKSTALRILAGSDNFSDQDILALDPKSQMEAVEGIWIYELCELEGLPRADTNKVTAFASRAIDRARPAYGRFRDNRPRQNIFVGTTNDDHYLRDMTGNRRFWPVKTGEIDLVGLERDRDQLWAEAAFVEASGASITLNEALWPAAKEQQDARMEDDPWMDALRNIKKSQDAGTLEGTAAELVDGFYRISTYSILTSILFIDIEKQSGWQSKRVAQIMRLLGWEGPMNLKTSGKVVKGYRIPADKLVAKFEVNLIR